MLYILINFIYSFFFFFFIFRILKKYILLNEIKNKNNSNSYHSSCGHRVMTTPGWSIEQRLLLRKGVKRPEEEDVEEEEGILEPELGLEWGGEVDSTESI